MIDFIQTYMPDLLAVYGGFVAFCTALVKLTPTKKDDAVLNIFLRIVECFSTAKKSESEREPKKL